MIPEQDFKRELREYLEGDVPDEVRELAEKLEMQLASPGDWDRVKKESEQGENDKGQVSRWLENLLVMSREKDYQGIQEALKDGWPSEWDADIDDMTYEGREEDPEDLRELVEKFRGFGNKKPNAELIKAALKELD